MARGRKRGKGKRVEKRTWMISSEKWKWFVLSVSKLKLITLTDMHEYMDLKIMNSSIGSSPYIHLSFQPSHHFYLPLSNQISPLLCSFPYFREIP